MFPYFYVIEQTNICNLHCPFCPNHLNQREKAVMKHELFKSVIDQLLIVPGIRATRLALHGCGEPFINPDFIDNLRYCDSHEFKNIDFSTNGMLLTEKIIHELKTIRCISWLRVSLNSTRKELMETINVGTNFETVVTNIKSLLKLTEDNRPFNVVIQLMQTKQNEDETFEDVFRLIERDDFLPALKVLDTFANQFEEANLATTIYGQPNCQFANNSYFIHSNGDLVGCCLDDTNTQVFGNVCDGIFSAEVQAKKQAFRSQLQRRDFSNLPFCQRCLNDSA